MGNLNKIDLSLNEIRMFLMFHHLSFQHNNIEVIEDIILKIYSTIDEGNLMWEAESLMIKGNNHE